MTSRIHAYEAIENFRDYGDYASRHGGRVAAGRLFRSAHHGAATAGDLQSLAALGLATLVDLRRPRERDGQPSRRHEGFAARVILCDLGDQAEAPHLAFLRKTDLSAASVRDFYLDYYDKAPFEARHRTLFAQYFKALAESGGPVLIHCTAGKDRTGLLAALTHHVLGVEEEDLIADYLLTNQAARLDERLTTMAAHLEAATGKVPSDTAVRAFLGVDAAFLEAGLAAMRREHGSLDGYLDAIGVDAARRDRVCEALLA
jgi:protein tyrosine/serine phosphatase